jgi:hypothetical protein
VVDSGKVAIVPMEDVYLQPVIVQSMEENVFQVYVSLVMLEVTLADHVTTPECNA